MYVGGERFLGASKRWLVVVVVMVISNWDHWAGDARRRQGVSSLEVNVGGEVQLE